MVELVRAAAGEVDARTLHAILRLRCDVFVVEQGCAYAEVDGRDLLEGTVHLWVREGEGGPYDGIVAYLRVLAESGGGVRIGRVVTAPAARGRGLARALLREALRDAPRPVVLNAQAHLVAFYEAEGFAVTGPEYLDDGIPHVSMSLGSSASGGRALG